MKHRVGPRNLAGSDRAGVEGRTGRYRSIDRHRGQPLGESWDDDEWLDWERDEERPQRRAPALDDLDDSDE